MTNGQLFLVTFPAILDPVTDLLRLSLQTGVLSIEIDQLASTQQAYATGTPSYLTDEQPVSYYGATVWHGYIAQPGNQLVRTNQTHATFNAAGAGIIVAVIDTGIDPTHPVLKSLIVNGYDFTRNVSGGSEKADVNVTPGTNSGQTGDVNQRTVAVLDQRTVAVLDGSNYSAFGHGTMTAGIVHLVAPQAKIMPLKAFNASGTGYDSDVLRAIYYAVRNGAQLMNMSFDFSSYSEELARAISYANSKGVVSVASAGNDEQRALVYPAALKGVVDVASTSNSDIQSIFTNYGAPPGVAGCAWRRRCDHLPLEHLRRRVGNFLQYAVRGRNRSANARHQWGLQPGLERSAGPLRCRLYRKRGHGIRTLGYLSVASGVPPLALRIQRRARRRAQHGGNRKLGTRSARTCGTHQGVGGTAPGTSQFRDLRLQPAAGPERHQHGRAQHPFGGVGKSGCARDEHPREPVLSGGSGSSPA
jgi:hypothetical protein